MTSSGAGCSFVVGQEIGGVSSRDSALLIDGKQNLEMMHTEAAVQPLRVVKPLKVGLSTWTVEEESMLTVE